MFRVRPSQLGDLEALLELAEHLNSYNLPFDRDAVAGVLEASAQAFGGTVPVQDRAFTFVAEDVETGDIAGTSTIYAQHGTHASPHVYLDVTEDEHYSETLGKYMVHQALRIGYNYNGPSEIGGLIVRPSFRGHPFSIGKLLSYTRFLYIAMHREQFRDEIISELLPPLQDDGTSRLWKHFGRRFTGLTYREADRISKDNKEFIKSLFPHGLIYTALFPQDVQDEIGEVGEKTLGVKKMLERIGFRYANQIDPFDGGPHYVARTDEVTLVKEAAPCTLAAVDQSAGSESRRYLVATAATTDRPFQATWATAGSPDDDLYLQPEARRALRLDGGREAPLWRVPV